MAAKWLWKHSKPIVSVGPPGDRHAFRWKGSQNDLGAAWAITFGKGEIPGSPIVSVPWEGRTLELYLDLDPASAPRLSDVLRSIRLVCLIPGGQASIRSFDYDSYAAVIGAQASPIVEAMLARLGVMLDRPATPVQFRDALDAQNKRRN